MQIYPNLMEKKSLRVLKDRD